MQNKCHGNRFWETSHLNMFLVFIPKLWNWCLSFWLFFFFSCRPLSLSEVKRIFSELGHCLPLWSSPRYLPRRWVDKQRRTTCVGDAATSTQSSPDGCNFCPHKAWTHTGWKNGVSKTMKGHSFTSRSVGRSRYGAEAISPTAGAFCRYSNCFVISKRQIV